jgi:uncharacterized membrane protein
MQRLMEILLGLHKGFLGRNGDYSTTFNPAWPWQDHIGATFWNVAVSLAALFVVIYVYRREGGGRPIRVALGIVRATLLALLIVLLNRPALTLEQVHREPSELAIMVDDSMSMTVKDAVAVGNSGPATRTTRPTTAAVGSAAGTGGNESRFDQALHLLSDNDAKLLRDLAARHTIHIYRFDRDAQAVYTVSGADPDNPTAPNPSVQAATEALAKVQVLGQSTQVLASVKTVMDDLQSQHVAGVVVLTDGRDSPPEANAPALNALKDFGVGVWTVPLGSNQPARNIAVTAVDLESSAFMNDLTDVKVTLRATGYEPNHSVTLDLKDKKTGKPLVDDIGKPIVKQVIVPDDQPFTTEIQFKPRAVGTLDLIVEAVPQPGETNEEDNVRYAQVEVLDTKIAVLYVDGYPRWDYRYLKNALVRDKTVTVSCLLTSADTSFIQEGTRPITRFPETMDELMNYDVVLFGDVDPRQFTDAQLQLVSDFVAQKGAGFGMVAGPKWSPSSYRNTPLEALLPVTIAGTQAEDDDSTAITAGFRPVLTPAGEESSIYRFFADRTKNEQFVRNDLPALFWYCRGIAVKPGVGEVYAEHPSDLGPDGRKAPILVVGRYMEGRTLFSAIDDSWRWRFYTGESIFDAYWVQQLRYLARGRKLGQRKLTFAADQPAYELGQTVTLRARALSPAVQLELPDQIAVQILDEKGQVVRRQMMTRQPGQGDLFVGAFTADRVGHLTAQLPAAAADVDSMQVPLEVIVPRLELSDPTVDRRLLANLSGLSGLGKIVEPADAATQLPLIPSAARVIPVDTSVPIWSAPLAMALFVLLITVEWILRKAYGMV